MPATRRLADLTDPQAVRRAMEEFDARGREAFLEKYGFDPAKSYFLVDRGKSYDSKAIAGVAYGYQHLENGPLKADEFSGGDRTVRAKLEALGFTVEWTGRSGRSSWSGTEIEDLRPGDILTNADLIRVFRVSNSGGMRRSSKTNTLVLISDYTKSLYVDEWHGDVLHYCGMGTKGDQSLDFMQNKTLVESHTNGVDLHLFEVYEKNTYTYVGRAQLDSPPYEDQQEDASKKLRRVWVFPLRIVSGRIPAPPVESIRRLEERQRKAIRRRSDKEVEDRAKTNGGRPASRSGTSTVYIRDQYVAEHARRRAKGKCDLCKQPAPFKGKGGEPFLEAHHVVWLAKGGEDTIENTVALCPNCHRKMHVVDDARDRKELLRVARAE